MTSSLRAAVVAVTILVLFLPTVSPRSLAAQAACVFGGGFLLMRNLMPATVGDCLENEHPGLLGTEQRTTGGQLSWRQADNRVLFTDGHSTWLVGPGGLSRRLNEGPVFPWEPGGTPDAWLAGPGGLDLCDEPNNKIENACQLSVRITQAASAALRWPASLLMLAGYLSSPDDVDAYALQIAEPGDFTATLQLMPGDYDLHLFDEAKTVVMESTTDARSDVAEIKARITVPGRYYLFVDSACGQASTHASYSLLVVQLEPFSPYRNPNDEPPGPGSRSGVECRP